MPKTKNQKRKEAIVRLNQAITYDETEANRIRKGNPALAEAYDRSVNRKKIAVENTRKKLNSF